MSMISELVKGLRKLGNQWKHNDVAGFNLIFDAADTIETLSEKVRASNLHNGWIPVSERLPEEDGEYLVASGEFIYVYSYGIPLMPMNERNRRWGWYESTSEGDFYMDVDAWMPLPKPYKGGDEV